MEQKGDEEEKESNNSWLFGAPKRALPASIVAAAAARAQRKAEAAAAQAAVDAEAALEAAAQAEEAAAQDAENAIVPVPDLARMTEAERVYIAKQIRKGQAGGVSIVPNTGLGVYRSVFNARLFTEFVVTGTASAAMEQYITQTIRFLGRLPYDGEQPWTTHHDYTWSPIAVALVTALHESEVYRRVAEELIRNIPVGVLYTVAEHCKWARATPTGTLRRTLIRALMDQVLMDGVFQDGGMLRPLRDALNAFMIGFGRRFINTRPELFQEAVDTILWPVLDSIWARPLVELRPLVKDIAELFRDCGIQLFAGLHVVLMLDLERFTDLMTRRPDAVEVLGIRNPEHIDYLLENMVEGEANFQRFPHVQNNVLWLLDHLTPMIKEYALDLDDWAGDLVLSGPTAVSDFIVHVWLDHFVNTPKDAIDGWPGRSKFLSAVLARAAKMQYHLAAPKPRAVMLERVIPLIARMKKLRTAKFQQLVEDGFLDEVPSESIYLPWPLDVNPLDKQVYLEFRRMHVLTPTIQTLMCMVVMETCRNASVARLTTIQTFIQTNWVGHGVGVSELRSTFLSRIAYLRYMGANAHQDERDQIQEQHAERWREYSRRGPTAMARPSVLPDYPLHHAPPFPREIEPFDAMRHHPPLGTRPLSSMQTVSDALNEVVSPSDDINALILEMYMGHSEHVDPRMPRILKAQRLPPPSATASRKGEEEEEKEGGNKRSKP